MTDDELRGQLERRSSAASFRAEELLPGIRRGVGGSMARPARVARWAPLAGLAAAAVIILALVVAWPRWPVSTDGIPPSTAMPSRSPQLMTSPLIEEKPTSAPATNSESRFDCGDSVELIDATGGVAQCIGAEVRDYHSAHQGVVAKSASVVEITWPNSYCVRSQRITVNSSPSGGMSGYVVNVAPTSFDPLCMDAPEVHAADIEFAVPVAPDAVALNVSRGVVECQPLESLGRTGQVAIYDGTGLITSCSQSVPPGQSTGDSATNPEPNAVLVRWTDEAGPAFVPITFNDVNGRFELGSGDWCNSCDAGRFEILIAFSQPINVSSLWLGLNGKPLAPAAVSFASPLAPNVVRCGYAAAVSGEPNASISPARMAVTVVDTTGLLRQCTAGYSPPDGSPPLIRNGHPDAHLVVLTWPGLSCVPAASVSLNVLPAGYSLTGESTPCDADGRSAVQYWVFLSFRQPVAASTVNAAMNGVPAVLRP